MTTHPEFNQEECVLRAFLIKLFEPALLLRELVVDLPDVYSLEEWVAVGGVGLSNVDKQMFAVLQWTGKQETRGDAVNLKTIGCKTLPCVTFLLDLESEGTIKLSPVNSFLTADWFQTPLTDSVVLSLC